MRWRKIKIKVGGKRKLGRGDGGNPPIYGCSIRSLLDYGLPVALR
jgi:hypothetical protein